MDPDSFWHDYGVKLVDGGPREGEKVLDGDGLPQNQQLPGVKRGGGSTLPGRLSRRCAEIIGEVGEEELYLLRSIFMSTWGFWPAVFRPLRTVFPGLGAGFLNLGAKTEGTAKKRGKNEQKWARNGLKRVG